MQTFTTHLSQKMDEMENENINRSRKLYNELSNEIDSVKTRHEDNMTAKFNLIQQDLSKNQLSMVEKVNIA